MVELGWLHPTAHTQTPAPDVKMLEISLVEAVL